MKEKQGTYSEKYQRVIKNIRDWKDGKDTLKVVEMYDVLYEWYGPESATNYCANLLLELAAVYSPD